MDNEIEDRVIALVRMVLIGGHNFMDITSATNLIDDLGADSLDMAELVIDVETAYDLSIGVLETAAKSWQTVGDVVRSVEFATEKQ